MSVIVHNSRHNQPVVAALIAGMVTKEVEPIPEDLRKEAPKWPKKL